MSFRKLLERGRRRMGLGPRSQLVMWFPASRPVPARVPPPPYRLQGFRAGYETAWAELLAGSGELGCWDVQRIRGEMAGTLLLEGQRFVSHGEQLVACAGVYDRALHGLPAWEIGWVATQPEHRGHGLGSCVTAAALAACRRYPPRPVFLRTDDFRLSAIGCYLKLGFVPDYTHPGYPQRWRDIRSALSPCRAELLTCLPTRGSCHANSRAC